MTLEDIRDTDKDQYWETLRQRWGALMSYRYIGRQFSSMNKVDDDTVTLRHDMRNAAGGILSQIFSISAPGGGGPSDLEVVPNPVIHSVQILDNGNDVQRIEVVHSGALKVGTRMYFGRATIVDADNHDRVLALIEGQGASIGDVPEHVKGDQLFEDDPIEHVEDSPDLPPIWQVFGGKKRDDGHWGLGELQAEFASPDAALHVGPQFVIHETAAIDLAAELVGTDRLQPESDHFMFLAAGRSVRSGSTARRRVVLTTPVASGCSSPCTTRATATAPSARQPRCSASSTERVSDAEHELLIDNTAQTRGDRPTAGSRRACGSSGDRGAGPRRRSPRTLARRRAARARRSLKVHQSQLMGMPNRRRVTGWHRRPSCNSWRTRCAGG